MAKIQLPRIATQAPSAPPPEQGPVFHQPSSEVAVPGIHALSEADALAMRAGAGEAKVSETAQQTSAMQTPAVPQPVAPQPSQPAPIAPTQPQLSDTLITLEVQRRLTAAIDTISEFRSEVTRTLHDLVAPRIEAVETALRLLEREIKGVRDNAATAVSRLDALDGALAAAELPTSHGTTPSLRLRLFRTNRSIIRKPEVAADGTSVIVFYNPRPAHEAPDPSEINVTSSATRNVDSGYVVDVPSGYVCDVFVGSDVVSSVSGKGETELIIPLRTRGSSRFVSAGGEIARLTLRRMERVGLTVE